MAYIDSDGQVLTIKNYNNRKEYRNSKGQYHRLDGPAIKSYLNEYSWYKEGKRHRIGGPAFFIRSFFIKGEGQYLWFIEDKRVNVYYIYG